MFRDSDSIVWVWGTKETTIAANTIREPFTYEFRIVPNHGEPKVTHFDAYSGRPKLRNKTPVEVTPYLTRELSLVKAFAPGEITIAQPEITKDAKTGVIPLPAASDTQTANTGE